MASKRLLKKTIAYASGDLFLEVIVNKLYVDGVDQEKADKLMSKVLSMQENFVKKANYRAKGEAKEEDKKKAKKVVKDFYRQLIDDIDKEINEIHLGIQDMNKKK